MKKKSTSLKVGSLGYDQAPTVELHTTTAIIVWNGRAASEDKQFIISFPSFLKRLHNMEDAITQDDPFADKTYYQIQKLIEEAKEVLASKKIELDDLLNSGHSRINFPETVIKKPAEVKIKSLSRLGWQAIELLLEVDDLAKLIFTAQHRGMINKKQKNTQLRLILSTIRTVLNQILQWRYTGITRDDYAANNGVAQEAKLKIKTGYDTIEPEFLDAKLRSDFAPDLPPKRLVVTPEESEKIDKDEVEKTIEKMKTTAKIKAG